MYSTTARLAAARVGQARPSISSPLSEKKNDSLLLVGLREWQVYGPSGASWALIALPSMAGVLLLAAVALRTGQGGSKLNGNVRGIGRPTGCDRDDDRFWKAGLLYANLDDPSVVTVARFGAGWTLNLGNPAAWLIIGGILVAWAGFIVIGVLAGA
ncbi:MAG: DUF5808 domain-containing protein [Trebonia sp.]